MLVSCATDKWEARALALATTTSTFSSCTRDQVGAVVLTPERDFVPGWNDTPAGHRNCVAGGCPRAQRAAASGSHQLDDELCLHAEANAVHRAGRRARGAILAVTREPCGPCRRAAILAGIVRIVVPTGYEQVA